MDGFAELLRRAQHGERAAMSRLWSTYEPRVRGLVRKRLPASLRRRYDSLDLTQSVFTEVMRDISHFEDRGEAAFRHWLYLKAESKVGQKLRRARGRGTRRRAEEEVDVELRAPGRSPPDEALRHEEDRRLGEALASLDDLSREVVRCKTREGVGFEEIAARLGLRSADAARKRHARALLALRERLAADV